jgi:RNA polymerase primary sigma factor
MVLAKLFSRSNLQIAPHAIVPLAQLDAALDVETERFVAVGRKLAKQMAKAQARLDLDGYREERLRTASPAVIADLPDVRGSHYQADLRRIPPMDRAEEFRMARRHEFLRSLVEDSAVAFGMSAEQAKELARQPARMAATALPEVEVRRGIHRAWLLAMLHQLEDLRNLYVEGALAIVLGTVNRYRGLGVDTADLIQEGNASLFQAIDGFDWRRDVRFRTYAQFWVHQAVLKMLYNSARTVRVPIWVQKVLGKIRRAQEAGRREGRELSPEEIGERIGVPAEKVSWVLSTRRYAVSLDAEVAGEDGTSLVQMLPDESLTPIPDAIQPGDLPQALATVMADLPEREQQILRARFGLGGAEPQTLGEIAEEMGITAERVRQLQNAALSRMKKPGKLRQLQAFVE